MNTMKRTLIVLTLLALTILAPCCSFGAEAPAPSPGLSPAAPNLSSAAAPSPRSGEDFMSWLKRQSGPVMKADNCLRVCYNCRQQGYACCENSGGVGCYCDFDHIGC
jgi:hypothetical protein